ncbi:MAG: hypothetical protein QM478_00190 [Flavobacteriaceae bacterium]
MKIILNNIIALVIIGIVLISCTTSTKRNPDFLPQMSIEIPKEITNDTELVKVIKSSEKAINELSDNLEQLVIDSKAVLEVKEEERSIMDNLKMGKLMVDFVSNSTELAKLIDEFDNYKKNQSSQGLISDAQLKALEKVGEAFENRMKQINEKYKNYFNE